MNGNIESPVEGSPTPFSTDLLLPFTSSSSSPSSHPADKQARSKHAIFHRLRYVTVALVAAIAGFLLLQQSRGLPKTWDMPNAEFMEFDIHSTSSDEAPERYLIRDWSPWLGWNNQRYIQEMSLTYAHMLNRTLVLPPFAGASYCEYSDEVCTAMAPRLTQRPEETSYPDQFPSGDPASYRLGTWVTPLSWFMDIDILKQGNVPVITWEEYRRRHGLPPSMGSGHGWFFPEEAGNLSYGRVEHELFEKPHTILVDWVPKLDNATFPPEGREKDKCDRALDGYNLNAGDLQKVEDAPKVVRGLSDGCLASHGFAKVWTYADFTFFSKAPIDPTPKIGRVEDFNGMADYLSQFNETVLQILGEMHWPQRSGGLVFTSRRELDRNTHRILTYIKPPREYYPIAERLIERMRKRCHGRAYRAAHMRRGDMVEQEWIKLGVEDHYKKLKEGLDKGTALLAGRSDLQKGAKLNASTVPLPSDPIYLATNERDPEKLKYLRSQNVILLSDLLTPADRREFGARSAWTDTLLLLSQIVMSRSAFFHGEGFSSVDGWVFDMRMADGVPRELSELEYSS